MLPRRYFQIYSYFVNINPKSDVIYFDEDFINFKGVRYSHYFKSAWNRELFFLVHFMAIVG